MNDPSDFERAEDILHHRVALRHVAELPVLGVPVRFESNGAASLAAVEASFGSWRALEHQRDLIAREGVRVRLIVHDGGEGPGPRGPITYRMVDAERIILHTAGSFGLVDVRRGDAVAYVTPALLADRDHFRYGVLEMLTLVLVASRDRHPVHAAGIVRGRTALLLAGPPGTGKSTLAYVALHHGCEILSDDAAYVQVAPEFRVWGMPGLVYLVPDVCTRFPELAGRKPERLANGDEKVAVDVPGGFSDSAAPVAVRAGVCLLERKGGAASLVRVERSEVEASLTRDLGPALELHRGTLGPALAHLAARGGWRLSLSDNPRDALPFIDEMFATLSD